MMYAECSSQDACDRRLKSLTRAIVRDMEELTAVVAEMEDEGDGD